MKNTWITIVLCLVILAVVSGLNHLHAAEITTEATLRDILNKNEYNIGDIIKTTGFYFNGDGGAGAYQVQGLSKTEAWQDTGYGWQLSKNGEIKYGTSKKLILIGSVMSSKKMGCKANGVSDDSVILRTMFNLNKELFIDEGYHIINIQPGNSHSGRMFVHEVKATTVKGVKGKSIIKLGAGNCDERKYTGFWALFRYAHTSKPNIDILWEGITIDYNPTSNPLYHYDSRFNSVDVNKQNIAIAVEGGRDFVVRECKFMGHSGANVVWYLVNQHNSREAQVMIDNNAFTNLGAETGSGCHDHSTIFIHNPPINALPDYRCKAYVRYNTFVAAFTGAPNAFNAIETGVDVLIENNNVNGYWQGILPYSKGSDVLVTIRNNNMVDVLTGIIIWPTRVDSMPSLINLPAYKQITISGNYHYIPVRKFLSKYYYLSRTETIPSGIAFFDSVARDIQTIEILDNRIAFDFNGVTNAGKCSNIDLKAGFSSGSQSRLTIPTLSNVVIKRNTLGYASGRAIEIASYAKLDNIQITDNTIYKSNWLEAGISESETILITPVAINNFSPEAHEIMILNNTFNNCMATKILTYFKSAPVTREANITIQGNIEQGTTNFKELAWVYNVNKYSIWHYRPYNYSDSVFHQIRKDGSFNQKVNIQDIYIRFLNAVYDHGNLTINGVTTTL